jgi:hypothetical protein
VACRVGLVMAHRFSLRRRVLDVCAARSTMKKTLGWLAAGSRSYQDG